MKVGFWLQVMRLRYTPRKFVINTEANTLVIAEADHASIPSAQRQQPDAMATDGAAASTQGIELDEEAAAMEDQLGAPKGDSGQWASCLRIVDPASLQTSRCAALTDMISGVLMCLGCDTNTWSIPLQRTRTGQQRGGVEPLLGALCQLAERAGAAGCWHHAGPVLLPSPSGRYAAGSAGCFCDCLLSVHWQLSDSLLA